MARQLDARGGPWRGAAPHSAARRRGYPCAPAGLAGRTEPLLPLDAAPRNRPGRRCGRAKRKVVTMIRRMIAMTLTMGVTPSRVAPRRAAPRRAGAGAAGRVVAWPGVSRGGGGGGRNQVGEGRGGRRPWGIFRVFGRLRSRSRTPRQPASGTPGRSIPAPAQSLAPTPRAQTAAQITPWGAAAGPRRGAIWGRKGAPESGSGPVLGGARAGRDPDQTKRAGGQSSRRSGPLGARRGDCVDARRAGACGRGGGWVLPGRWAPSRLESGPRQAPRRPPAGAGFCLQVCIEACGCHVADGVLDALRRPILGGRRAIDSQARR
eukprot:scaffold140_cov565-Prasinococcus_capsulatus_cf.AAC.34